MPNFLFTRQTQIEILKEQINLKPLDLHSFKLTYVTDGAVISRLNMVFAVVASVNKLILPLIMELVEHAER